jgi:hypothetical protein
MYTKADPSICQILQDPLWWVTLCLPLKGRRKKYKKKAKIKPYELNQYNLYTTWNNVDAKPVF